MGKRACILVAWCALMSACSPTNPSSPATLDGQWSGTTAQGTPIAFTVSPDQKVTAITIGYSFSGCSGTQTFSGLNLETAPNVICVPAPCPASVTSFRSFNYATGPIEGPGTSINGLFMSPARAEGAAMFREYPGCGSATGVAWSATKR